LTALYLGAFTFALLLSFALTKSFGILLFGGDGFRFLRRNGTFMFIPFRVWAAWLFVWLF